jgi:LuxR family glucitol operon transcriptional activator
MVDELGSLLKTMIDILKARRGQKMVDTLAYLEDKLGYSHHTIRKWCQGKHSPDVEILALLVEIGVSEAGMDRQWADRILYQGEHPQLTAILHRLFPTGEAQGVRHNLPRRPYIRLVGREKDLAEAMRRLVPEERHWLVPIEGVGGVGKSALAMEVGWRFVEGYDRFPPGRCFDAIIWASAKREVLTTRGIEQVELPRSPITNLDDVYQAIADVLGWEAIQRASREDRPGEVEKALRHSGQVLLILDNLETVDDPQVLAFLRDLPPPAKAVATMRFHEDMPYPIRLRELDKTAAEALAVQECMARNLILSANEMQYLLEYTRGLPLAVWWAVGLKAMEGYNLQAILGRLGDPQGELLHFIFGEAIDRLKSRHLAAYRTLLALSFFDSGLGAALESLVTTTGLDIEACQAALHRLLNLNLVNRGGTADRFTMLPLTHSYTQAELTKAPGWQHKARERWMEWYIAYLNQYGGKDRDWDDFQALEREYLNILAAIDWCLQHSIREAVWLIWRFWYFWYIRGYWEACEHYTRQALSLSKELSDHHHLSLLLKCRLGWLLKEKGKVEGEALSLLHEAEAKLMASGDIKLLAESGVLTDLGQAYLLISDFRKAESYLKHHLTVSEKEDYRRGTIVARYYLGQCLVHQKRPSEAEHIYQHLLQEARSEKWERAIGYVSLRLGETLAELGKIAEAEEVLVEAGHYAERWREKLLHGHVKFALAKLRQVQNSLPEAEQLADEAYELYRQLGTEEAVEAKVFLQQFAKESI